MNKLFVSYELAKLAKEKGFNQPCIGCYFNYPSHNICSKQNGDIVNSITYRNSESYIESANNNVDNYLRAPLYQQLVDWFREKHEIHIYITPSYFREDSLEKHPGYGYNIKRLFIKFRGRYTSTSKYSFKEINDKLIDINGMLLKGSDNYLNTLSIALENAFKLI